MGQGRTLVKLNAIGWLLLASLHLEAAERRSVPLLGAALPRREPAADYRVTAWTTEHGLPDSRVQAVLQTQDGFLWLGTVGGLVRFDGVRFKVFNFRNVPAFHSDNCLALAEDRAGGLWTGTADGLIRYAGRAFTHLGRSDGLPESMVWRLALGNTGEVWVGTENAVTQIFTNRLGLPQLFPRLRAQNCAFYGDSAGRARLAVDLLSPPGGTNAPPDEPVTQYLVAADGTTWFTTPAELYRRTPGDSPEIVWRARAPEDTISALAEAPGGGVWLGTVGGNIISWSEGEASRIGKGQGLAGGKIHALTVDREGNLWAGTEDGGLIRIWQPAFRALGDERTAPAENNTWAVCAAPDDTIWVASDGGLLRYTPEDVRCFTTADGLPADAVKALLVDRNQALWIGTGKGLAVLREGRIELVPLDADEGGSKVRVLFEDAAGTIWVGTAKGVYRFAQGRRTRMTSADGLPQEDVRSIHQDAAGRIWLGTFGGGILVLEPGTPRVLTHRDGLPSDYVCTLVADASGTLWAGTSGGLAAWRGDRFRSLTRRDGLREDTVNGVVDDGAGGLWIGGNRGVYRLNQEELKAFMELRTERVHPAWFGAIDGLPSDETNGEKSSPAGCRLRRGEILFPTKGGVAVIDPSRALRNPAKPLVAIDLIRVDDTVLWGDEVVGEVEPRGRPGDRRSLGAEIDRVRPLEATIHAGSGRLLEIEYTAATFAGPNQTRFRYRLEGLEDEWTEANERRIAYYTRLRPGRYRFVVMASNSRGISSEPGAEFAFTLEPRFFETTSFGVAAAVTLVALGAGLWQLKLSVARRVRQAEEQSLVDRERARIARDLHDDLGVALTRIVFRSELAARGPQQAGSSEEAARGIAAAAREAVQSLAEVVWATNPGRDDLESLGSFLCQQAEKLLDGLPTRLRLEVQHPLPSIALGSDFRHNLYQAVKEALNNAMKHAQAGTITLRLAVAGSELRLAVEDDGCGFDPDASTAAGNGLVNLRTRIEALSGTLTIASLPGHGTKIQIRVRLPGGSLPAASDGSHAPDCDSDGRA